MDWLKGQAEITGSEEVKDMVRFFLLFVFVLIKSESKV